MAGDHYRLKVIWLYRIAAEIFKVLQISMFQLSNSF